MKPPDTPETADLSNAQLRVLRAHAGRLGVVAGALLALVAVLALVAHASNGAPAGPQTPGGIGPEGLPMPTARVLAPAASPAPGQTIAGISCGPTEQVVFHIHAHLTLFVNGQARAVPLGVGIAPPLQIQSTPAGPYAAGGSCFSFLHTHAADGIIHVESPVARTYTLGDFFDIWKQPLGRDRVGPATGPVAAFLNTRRYTRDPRTIPLDAHAQIQLDVGRPLVAPASIAFPASL
jgi:hypothetical protein